MHIYGCKQNTWWRTKVGSISATCRVLCCRALQVLFKKNHRRYTHTHHLYSWFFPPCSVACPWWRWARFRGFQDQDLGLPCSVLHARMNLDLDRLDLVQMDMSMSCPAVWQEKPDIPGRSSSQRCGFIPPWTALWIQRSWLKSEQTSWSIPSCTDY